MNSSLRPILFFLYSLILCFCHMDRAWGEPATETQLDFTEGVIVLDDGRVFSGTISNVAGGYRVDWNGTYAIVPFAKVDVTAPTLNAAYIALRDRVLKPTAADHLQLAEWCLSNKLVGQARSEVTKALTLEPLRPEARVLMAQIDELLNPEKQKVQVLSQAAMTIDGFLRAEQNRSSGMSRQAHQDFIRQLQPLLMNKCGNANCHGAAAQNSFQLQAIQRGTSGNRLQSQQNLDAVLKFVDRDQPDRSRLLLIDPSLDAIHRKVFLGSRGAIQYQLLANWVAAVTGKPLVASPQSAIAATPVPTILPNASNPIQLIGGETHGDSPAKATTPAQQAAIRQAAIQQSQPDPFDPEVFNRRVHGSTAGELKESNRAEIKD